MATAEPTRAGRIPLTRERVLRAAIDLADREGIESVTMRRLGQEVGVEAMSLYNHVAGKDDVLDGMVDLLIGDVSHPSPRSDWKAAIKGQALAARAVQNQHPWARRLMTSRPIVGGAILRTLDWAVAQLLEAGFSNPVTHQALHVIGSHLLGYTQELLDPRDASPGMEAVFGEQVRAGALPNLMRGLVGVTHDDDVEFEFGLDLMLNGLEQLRGRPEP